MDKGGGRGGRGGVLPRSFLQLRLRHDSFVGVSMKLKGRIVDLLFFFMSDEQRP